MENLEGVQANCPIIRTMIRKESGQSVTDIWRNGKIIKTVLTDESQIRPKRVSCLWVSSGEPKLNCFDGFEGEVFGFSQIEKRRKQHERNPYKRR